MVARLIESRLMPVFLKVGSFCDSFILNFCLFMIVTGDLLNR